MYEGLECIGECRVGGGANAGWEGGTSPVRISKTFKPVLDTKKRRRKLRELIGVRKLTGFQDSA